MNRNPSLAQAGLFLINLALVLLVSPTRADQVEMRSGDRYLGNVVSLSTNTLVLESSVLGTLRLPRSQVAVISLGQPTSTNSTSKQSGSNIPSQAALPPSAESVPSLPTALSQLNSKSGSIQDVRNELLKDAGPEANQKFNELVGGLITGKITVSDLRGQAQSLSEQVRALRKDLGEDTVGGSLDGYLAILDKFLRDTAPANTTSRPAKP